MKYILVLAILAIGQGALSHGVHGARPNRYLAQVEDMTPTATCKEKKQYCGYIALDNGYTPEDLEEAQAAYGMYLSDPSNAIFKCVDGINLMPVQQCGLKGCAHVPLIGGLTGDYCSVISSASSTDWQSTLVTELSEEGKHLDETAAGYVVARELDLAPGSTETRSSFLKLKRKKTSSKGYPIRTKALDPPLRRRHTSHHEGGLSRYGNSVAAEYVDSATETMATGVSNTRLGAQGDRIGKTGERGTCPNKLKEQNQKGEEKNSASVEKSSNLMASSVPKKSDSKMARLFRRAAYVERRPDVATRTTALPPPPRRKGKTDKKSVVFEKQKVEKDDDEIALLDEEMMMVEENELKPEQSGRIVRRHLKRQVVMEEVYTEKEIYEEEGFEYRMQKRSWWMRTLTACMPSEDL
ncbi:uncharacterized protein PAC_09214 [Phialocephala subalpina]|uniref:LysM domain-containing protein n=1 Tax=Phialocephala subalpina TaxID=576137 RepID=A0A1L7X2R6_9HELO|nr:uncharacterized protein PAC_09214 [Phialocephala subalpina]